ncbi:type II toxin-antitoxin system VapC family toxin [Stutzerimonas nitrititolerans]|uniref:type II toxin-antitoxin system VapC family toxin n=1 Tax=Stutzerimonas nitrititolerans TaxID=2482751 RepID=UPI002649E75C|nr:hypothetical protein [Stutzerimonas nitrititolerans]
MKLLLDTPILPWACAAPSSLPAEAVALTEDRGNDLLFSAASIWEVGIKNAMGKPGYRFEPDSTSGGLCSMPTVWSCP